MSNTIIKTLEGTVYKLQLNVSNVADFTEYCVYGSCEPIGRCEKQAVVFNVGEVTGNSVEMYIPALKSGNYQYQVFIRRTTTNQEFMVLQGRIEVANRIGTDEEAVAPYSSIVDVALNADTVEVNVTVQEGTKGDKGDKGDTGTVDLSLLTEVVEVKPQGTQLDNYNTFGFSYKLTKGGTIQGLTITDRSSGGIITSEPIFIKIWSGDNRLLAKSRNGIEHSLGGILEYEFEPFTVEANETLKVTFHTLEGMEENTYKVGIQACVRVVTLVTGEEGSMIGPLGGNNNNTLTAVHTWKLERDKFATKQELEELKQEILELISNN